jgi:hypothetical protein
MIDDSRCFECGATEDIHQHHVVPRIHGGTRTIPLCYCCHMKVHGRKAKGLNHRNLTTAGLQRKRNEGFILGKAKYGYKISECRKSLIEVESEQDVIRLVGKMRAEKVSWKKVAAHLNDSGYTTRSGGTWALQNTYRVFTGRSVLSKNSP